MVSIARSAGIAVALLGLTGAGVSAEMTSVEKPGRVVSSVVKRVVIVEGVNRETRELRLMDAQGSRYTVVAGEEVRNFDQIQARDRIVAEYLESVAVVVAPEGEALPIGDAAAVAVAPEGAMPGMEMLETEVVTATIEAINLSDRLVTIQDENGNVRTIKVSPRARLELVDVGDQIRLRLTRAVAVSIQKPD